MLGDTKGFFKVPAGCAVYDLSKMASEELAIPLTTGIQKVFRTHQPLIYNNIQLRIDGAVRTVKMEIAALPDRRGQESLVGVFLSVLKEKSATREISAEIYDIGTETQQRIKDLELELQFTKENLQATIEELETSNEELQATNEELLASNEELQSANEELQSANEELYTVASEYQNKINELTELNNDVDNLLTSSKIGKLMLDEDLLIRKYSPEVNNIFLIMEADIGRPITHLANRLVDFNVVPSIKLVQESNHSFEKEVRTEDGHFYLLRIVPYHIGPATFSGVVVTFVDISELKKAEMSLVSSSKKSDDIIQHMPSGLFVFAMSPSGELLLEHSNPAAEALTGISDRKWAGHPIEDVWPGASEAELPSRLLGVMAAGESIAEDRVPYRRGDATDVCLVRAFRLPDDRLAVVFESIAAELEMRLQLDESEARCRHLFETMTDGVVYQDSSGRITAANPAATRILGVDIDQMMGRTSMDPAWRVVDTDGEPLTGEAHPSMVALRTGEPVLGFKMGVFNPRQKETRWLWVDAVPQKRDGSEAATEVYTVFRDITE